MKDTLEQTLNKLTVSPPTARSETEPFQNAEGSLQQIKVNLMGSGLYLPHHLPGTIHEHQGAAHTANLSRHTTITPGICMQCGRERICQRKINGLDEAELQVSAFRFPWSGIYLYIRLMMGPERTSSRGEYNQVSAEKSQCRMSNVLYSNGRDLPRCCSINTIRDDSN